MAAFARTKPPRLARNPEPQLEARERTPAHRSFARHLRVAPKLLPDGSTLGVESKAILHARTARERESVCTLYRPWRLRAFDAIDSEPACLSLTQHSKQLLLRSCKCSVTVQLLPRFPTPKSECFVDAMSAVPISSLHGARAVFVRALSTMGFGQDAKHSCIGWFAFCELTGWRRCRCLGTRCL